MYSFILTLCGAIVFEFGSGYLAPAYGKPLAANGMSFQTIFSPNDDIGHAIGGVHAIAQDRHGFMWFGGESGLARYDGWHTKLYEANPDNPQALIHAFVRRLLVDSRGTLWVGTERGLCRYHETMDNFDCRLTFNGRASLPRVATHAIAVDHANRLYIGTSEGVYTISSDRQWLEQIELVSDQETITNDIFVVDLVVDHLGELWIATKHNGLFRYSPPTQATEHYHVDPENTLTTPFNITSNKLKSLMVDSQNQLWIGSFGGGFSVLNAERNDFRHFQRSRYGEKGLYSDVIWDIYEDAQREIWVIVDHSGLVHFDRENQRFTSYRHKPYDQQSLPTNQLRSIYEDKNGDLWLGSFPGGVAFHNRATREFQNFRHEPDNSVSLSHSSVLSLAVDPAGTMWVGTEDGLNKFDRAAGTFQRFQKRDNIGLNTNAVLSLAVRDASQLWVGTWSGGLMKFDTAMGRFLPAFENQLNPPLTSRFIWDILLDDRNRLLLGTEFSGVNVVNLNSGNVRFLDNLKGEKSELPHDFVWDVMQDSQDQFWFATQGGLAYFDNELNELGRFKSEYSNPDAISSELTIAVYEDHQKNIWIGTQDQGAFVYNPKNQSFRQISIEQGLPSRTVSGFIEDQLGEIWMATTNGVARFDRVTRNIQTLTKENGLVGNNFNRKAMHLGKHGLLYIGGADGLSVFHPERAFKNIPDFSVNVTALRIFNHLVRPKKDSPLKTSVVLAKRIELDHDDTMFSLDFAATNYRSSASTRYAYQLEGFDEGWNYVREYPSATYTNIQPGHYIFRVRASRKNLWVESTPLEIIVKSPPWYSSWAWVIYLILFALLAFFFAKYWHFRMRAQIYKSLSTQDALTGLSNRMGLMQQVEALYRASSARHIFSFIFLDIDHFKRVNDQRGHQVGDRVLQELADLLRNSIRGSDVYGRWGGEEFLFICSVANIEDAKGIAEKVRSQIAAHVFCAQQEPLKITASLGVTMSQRKESFNETLKRADRALYEAKAAGRNCVCVAE